MTALVTESQHFSRGDEREFWLDFRQREGRMDLAVS